MTRNPEPRKAAILRAIYQKLFDVYGPQHWWPGRTSFEVCVGAILTQNTNWKNVEKAIANLRRKKILSFSGLKRCPATHLASLIRPAGYFNVKARRLKNFVDFLDQAHRGSLSRLGRRPWPAARAELLGVNGIGQETADSILLYALNKPVFVIDAYTRRLLARHGFSEAESDYGVMQALFMESFPADVPFFNEYHALIVRLGKDFGKDALRREDYPLRDGKYFL